MANNAETQGEVQKTVVDSLLEEIEREMEHEEKSAKGEKSEEKRKDNGSNPASGEATLPVKKKKPSRGKALARRAEYKNKCLTCEQSGHHWRACRQACAHHQRQGKTAHHNGKECPLDHSLYKRLGSVAQSRADFERTTKAKLALELRIAAEKGEAEAREKEEASYELAVAARIDRVSNESSRIEREFERVAQPTAARQAPTRHPSPLQRQPEYYGYALPWAAYEQCQTPLMPPQAYWYLPPQQYRYDEPRFPEPYLQPAPQHPPQYAPQRLQYPQRQAQQYARSNYDYDYDREWQYRRQWPPHPPPPPPPPSPPPGYRPY